jgi:hypothetical protein
MRGMNPMPASIVRSTAALALATALLPAAASAAPPKPARGVAPLAQAANRNGHSKRAPAKAVTAAKNGHSKAPRVKASLASVSSASVDNFTASGACNSYDHTNAFGSSVMLNNTRFPSGAYVVLRYAFHKIGVPGWRYTRWYGPTPISNRVPNTDPDVSILQPIQLRQVSFNIYSGRYIAWAKIGVWNGSDYEYTSTYGDSYNNTGRFGLFQGDASSCWLTV